jgi:hypothetical protein
MKKIILLYFGIVLLLLSCNFDLSNLRSKQLTLLMNEESVKIGQMSNDIITCLTEKNREALKELFCENIRNRQGFDNDIDKALEYFKCNQYTKSLKENTANGGESREYGKRTYWYVMPTIDLLSVLYYDDVDSLTNIESRYYSIHYQWMIINDKDKTLEGLHSIEIELLNIDSFMLGERIH